jgi:lantibiotic biosynthesis protein
VDATTSAAALAVAAEVGARVADPARVAEAVAAASGQTAHPASVHWRDHAVGQGHAGLALLFGALDQHDPGQGWDRTAHQHLVLAARAVEAVPRPPAGLFGGLAGLGLVATTLSDDGARYRRLLAAVDQALVARLPALVGAPGRVGGRAVREYDLISGLTGIGAYLLLRRGEPGVAGALRSVLAGLVELTGRDQEGPRWRTLPGQLSPEERARYPHGYLNCGLAHGIPGPLAVLSLALRAGADLPGLPDAVVRAAAWLAAHRAEDASGPTWPNAVPLPAARAGDGSDPTWSDPDSLPAGRVESARPTVPFPVAPARAAWCYGGPGVAAALRLAGDALGRQAGGTHGQVARHRDLAVTALSAALTRPADVARIDSPTFCHGRAGLLAVTSSFARATGDDQFRRAAAGMAAELVDRFDPALPLGYRDLESGGRRIDQPGLLTGAPGIALALLGATSPAEPAWARLFLVA